MSIAKNFLSSANRYGANSYERNRELLEAFYWFGAYLHTQQDKISHSGDYGNMAVLVGFKPLFFFHPSWGGIDDMNREYLNSGYTTGEVASLITALAMVCFKLSIKREFPSVYREILR